MKTIEENIIRSFNLAKKDIYKLVENYTYLSGRIEELSQQNKALQAKILEISLKLKNKPAVKALKAKIKKAAARKKAGYVVSLKSKKVHNPKCVFAKNVKRKNRKVFAAKRTAINRGFRPCKCLY